MKRPIKQPILIAILNILSITSLFAILGLFFVVAQQTVKIEAANQNRFDLAHVATGNAGHHALRCCAEVFKAICGGKTVICRWGGEEFLIIAKGMARPEAVSLAERLRRETEAYEIRYGQNLLQLTITVGVAECDVARTVEQNIFRVDQALYESKNKICPG